LNFSQRNDATVKSIIHSLIDQVSQWKRDVSCFENRTFVTLSFAQSLDAKIAIYLDSAKNQTSANYPLSSSESLLLTHALRSIHDGILIGGRTLSTDNPRLTNRLWMSPSTSNPTIQPRPIVLDPTLRHIRQCLTSLRARNLIVCCSHESAIAATSSPSEIILENDSSIVLLPCDTTSNGQLDLKSVLMNLRSMFGIKSLMVEGGSAILSSFVQGNLVDCLCITIAPKVLGSRGLTALMLGEDYDRRMEKRGALEFGDTKCYSIGNDCIILARNKE